MLPKNAYGGIKNNLDKACTKAQAYDAMLVVKTAVVRAGRSYRVTSAMKEWSKLGWFETAAFAVMRAHCCPDAAALKAPRRLARCRMKEALAHLADGIDSDPKTQAAADAFADAARCIARRGGGGSWGRFTAPYGSEKVYFNKVYGRLKKARGR